MSAPLAGRFVDHYEVFGVDPKADIETIKAAYSKLAAKYSPANAETGNKEKFDELNSSYEVLIDPHLRSSFDSVKGGGGEEDDIAFPVEEFLSAMDADVGRRVTLLTLLYYRRKYNPISPGISMRLVETVLNIEAEMLAFNVWVLKQQGLIMGDDKSRLLITIAGVDHMEKHPPTPAQVRAWLRPEEERQAIRAKAAGVKAATEAKASAAREVAAAAKAAKAMPPPKPLPGQQTSSGVNSLRSILERQAGSSPANVSALNSRK